MKTGHFNLLPTLSAGAVRTAFEGCSDGSPLHRKERDRMGHLEFLVSTGAWTLCQQPLESKTNWDLLTLLVDGSDRRLRRRGVFRSSHCAFAQAQWISS